MESMMVDTKVDGTAEIKANGTAEIKANGMAEIKDNGTKVINNLLGNHKHSPLLYRPELALDNALTTPTATK